MGAINKKIFIQRLLILESELQYNYWDIVFPQFKAEQKWAKWLTPANPKIKEN